MLVKKIPQELKKMFHLAQIKKVPIRALANLFLLVISFLVISQPVAAETFKDRVAAAMAIKHYAIGFRYDLLGLTNQAALEYEKAAQFDGLSPVIHLRLGAAYARLNMLAEAERELVLAAEFDPNDIQARYLLALIYSTKKEYDRAAGEYELILNKLSKDNPQNVEIYGYLAQLYYSQKRYQDSIQQFKKILEIDPQNIESMYLMGSLYMELNDVPAAIEVLKQAISTDPEHDGSLNTLAYIYAENDMHLDEALQLITRALEINPDNGAYLDSLGWVYYKKGEYENALEVLKKADALIKDPVIYEHLGDVHFKLNQHEDAVRYWELSLELLPGQEKVIQKINAFKDNHAKQNSL